MIHDESNYCHETRIFLTNAHLSKFSHGDENIFAGVCFIPKPVFEIYCKNFIGYDDINQTAGRGGQWLFPISCLDQICDIWDEEKHTLRVTAEKYLNFTIPDSPIKICVRIGSRNIIEPLIPVKTTPGVNSLWKSGGFTRGGIPEIVVKKAETKKYHIFEIEHNCNKSNFIETIRTIKNLIYV